MIVRDPKTDEMVAVVPVAELRAAEKRAEALEGAFELVEHLQAEIEAADARLRQVAHLLNAHGCRCRTSRQPDRRPRRPCLAHQIDAVLWPGVEP